MHFPIIFIKVNLQSSHENYSKLTYSSQEIMMVLVQNSSGPEQFWSSIQTALIENQSSRGPRLLLEQPFSRIRAVSWSMTTFRTVLVKNQSSPGPQQSELVRNLFQSSQDSSSRVVLNQSVSRTALCSLRERLCQHLTVCFGKICIPKSPILTIILKIYWTKMSYIVIK